MTAPGPASIPGPTWVLLHHFGGSARSWGLLAPALGGLCVAPDLRGFGGAPPGGAMRVADYADDIAALLAAGCVQAGCGPAGSMQAGSMQAGPMQAGPMPAGYVLAGHSMGGKVALALAARRPPGLRGLVLVAPSPPGPEPMDDAARAKLRAAWGDPAAAGEVARSISRHRDGPVHDLIVSDHLRASREAWTAWLDRGSREDLRALAAQIQVPILVVAGADDAALGPDVQARETLPHLPGAAMQAIGDARHLVPLDQPDALAAVMQGWARDQAGAPA